jgi:hypothetical protein
VCVRSGYHRLKVQECNIPKTAFVSRYGMYEFTVMSFGLRNALAYFMYMMNKVFMEYLNMFVVLFIDDIVIPHSEIMEMKPPYMCLGCLIHTYSNNMINICHIQ